MPKDVNINLYLWALPFIALETLFFVIYRKSDKLKHFYRHKIAIIGSLEYVLSRNDIKFPDEKRGGFMLQQYAKLYEPPLFIGETSATISKEGFSRIKIS
jgi:hypothetical protein